MSKRQTISDYIPTRRDVGLAQWQRMMGAVTFGAALGLMAASYVSLHWALDLVTGNAIVACTVPLVLEAGMAATAAVASTTRKPNGHYFIAPWLIFGFVMVLSQAANIGHAMVVVEPRVADLPAFIPVGVVYAFAGLFAALFPLGGPMFVHVSGFIRANAVDSNWVDEDARTVRVATEQESAQRVRAQAPASTPSTHAPQPATARATSPAATAAPAPATDPSREEAYQRYALARLDGHPEWTAKEVAAACGVTSAPQGSRIRAGWRDRYDEEHPEERRTLHLAEREAPEADVHAAG